LEFLIEGKPVYLAWENKKAALKKDPFYFNFTVKDDLVIFSYNNKATFAYLVEPAESETNRTTENPIDNSALIDILEVIYKGVLILIFTVAAYR
jgi:hypothetical protein